MGAHAPCYASLVICFSVYHVVVLAVAALQGITWRLRSRRPKMITCPVRSDHRQLPHQRIENGGKLYFKELSVKSPAVSLWLFSLWLFLLWC